MLAGGGGVLVAGLDDDGAEPVNSFVRGGSSFAIKLTLIYTSSLLPYLIFAIA